MRKRDDEPPDRDIPFSEPCEVNEQLAALTDDLADAHGFICSLASLMDGYILQHVDGAYAAGVVRGRIMEYLIQHGTD